MVKKRIKNAEMDALAWQEAMGADVFYEEQPQNRMQRKQVETVEKPKPTIGVQPVVKIASPKSLESEVRALADAAKSLDELREMVKNFKGLAICKTAINTVFADGTAGAPVLFVGEAPGANEDEQGIPFCGASGQLMNRAVSWIGLERSKNWYITNTVFWRPPGNRKPTTEETNICRPFVEKHIALAKPKLIVLVGGTATASLWDESKGITKLRGQFDEYTNLYLNEPIAMTAIFHPSFLMRSPHSKKAFWFDLLKIQDFMKSNGIS